ncbi:phage tail spike protein [Virgibacillus sp.]|uniref:phage tail spike protein n=1 Tax=Virgibacillus sp. TaxID=1872700 RepID=UPI0017A05F38|nr:phage tail spike protein [Virgibacillus sp.]NWO12414.1 tail fiber domain-containing protein [Virgibacillus sp.]
MKERIFIFNKYDELLAITNHYVEAIFEETVEKPVSFSITFPMSDKDAAYFVGGNQVAFKDLKGNLRLFTIREVDDIDGEAPEKVIQCMPAMQELTDVIVTDGETVNESAEAVLGIILQYSRWKVGHVADLGLYDISFSYQNAYDCLGKLTSRWGGEIVDRIEVAGNKITGRYIDIVQRKGSDTGKRFEMDKDIKNLTRTVLYYPKTALYGQGKSLQSGEEGAGKVTFRDVEWVKEKGDPTDKPKGQAWVGDSVALETHGVFNHETGELMHRFGLFEDNDEEDPEKLLVKTWEAVQTEKAPKVQYEMDIITFYGIADYEHEHVFLGDTGIARDKDMKPMVLVEARIMSWKYDIGNPRDGSLVLGNILDLNPDERDMDWVIDKVKEDSASWDAGGGPITDGRFPNIVPDTPQDVSATGLFKKIMLSWTFESTYAIAAYEIYASQINGFVPDSTNLVFRGKVGAYNFDADTDEKWYFRVRAVNTHGTASEYSEQVSASTVQLHLSDLEEIVPDFIEYGIYKGEANPSPSEYKYWLNTSENPNILYHWDEESESWKPLAPKNAADVGAISIADYQEQVGQLVTDLANKVDAEWVNGRLVAKANKADVYTVEQLDNKFDNVVSKAVYESDQQGIITDLQNQESRISQTETDIQSKVSNQQYTQDKESLRTSINENQSSIEQNAELIASKVSNEEYRTDKEGIINDIKANKSSIEQNAESIRSKVDATYVEDEIGKIEVGGRNLIQDSEERTMEAASDNNFMHVTLYNRLEKDTIYTLSFQAEFLEGSSDVISIYPYKKSGQSMAVIDMPYQINRMSATFQTDNRFHYNLLVYAGENGNTAGNKLKLTRIKLEKGNKATDWTPAPEDTQAEIQSIEQYASEIEQTAKGIKQNVNSLETDYSTFKKEANSTFDQQATQIALRVTETIYNTDMEDMTMRVSEAESSIEQNADEIVSKVSKNGVLSSINQSPEQIKINAQRVSIDGDLVVRNGKVYVKDGIITDNLISGNAKIDGAKIADASITNAKIGNMSVAKLSAGTLDTNRIKIQGGDSTEYSKIEGSKILLRGTYKRTWKGQTSISNVNTRFMNGHLRFRDEKKSQSIYMSSFGLSTFVDGEGEYREENGSSGTIEWWDGTYSPSNANGITMSSYGGVVALRSDFSHVVIDSHRSADIKSQDSVVFITPRASLPGNSDFWFNRIYDTNDGFLMFGSRETIPNSGLRFSKSGNTISVVDENYSRGGNTTFDVGTVRTNAIYKRNSDKTIYWNGTSGGNTSINVSNSTLRASGIRANTGSSDIFLATNDGAVRVTDGKGYNQGKGINYRPIAAERFAQISSIKYKKNINPLGDLGLEVINKLKVVEYDLINNPDAGTQTGLLAEHSKLVSTESHTAIDLYKLAVYNTKAIQELSSKLEKIVAKIGSVKL